MNDWQMRFLKSILNYLKNSQVSAFPDCTKKHAINYLLKNVWQPRCYC